MCLAPCNRDRCDDKSIGAAACELGTVKQTVYLTVHPEAPAVPPRNELRGVRGGEVGCLDKPRAEVGWVGVRCQRCEFCLSFCLYLKSPKAIWARAESLNQIHAVRRRFHSIHRIENHEYQKSGDFGQVKYPGHPWQMLSVLNAPSQQDPNFSVTLGTFSILNCYVIHSV